MTFDVVLTGVGAVSPLGRKDEFLRAFGRAPGEVAIAAPPAGNLLDHLGVKHPKLRIARYMDPVAKNAIVAADDAMADAGIAPAELAADPFGFGIVLGATQGPAVTRDKAYEQLHGRDGKLLSSTLFSHFGYNIAGAMTAIAHIIKGPNLTLSGRDLWAQLLRRVRGLLRSGKAHTVLTGFTECRPLPPGQLAEWACILCLERADRAQKRGARGVALDELPLGREAELAGPIRLPRPLPEPFTAADAAAAGRMDRELGLCDPVGIGPEYLPLIHAGRIHATHSKEDLGDVGFPVATRTGLSLLGLAWT